MTSFSTPTCNGFEKVRIDAPVFLLGMPRSGTTWLSQIFDSSADFVVRLSPNYSYALKNSIGPDAVYADWVDLFRKALLAGDAFMTMNWLRDTGEIERFEKPPSAARWLAIKDTRFHPDYLKCLEMMPAAKCIYIVRSPGGALNSWRKCKEFPKGSDFREEWRSGRCRKRDQGGEYWGFEDWRLLTTTYLERAKSDPGQYLVVRYEDLVQDPPRVTRDMFTFIGADVSMAVIRFLERSHAKHDDRPYSTFKDPALVDRWKAELPLDIQAEIRQELEGGSLEALI